MAQIFPSDRDDAGGAAAETLVWTLRTLPDPWTLLRDRRIDASGELIDLVLVHPEIGVALIDEAPRDPAAGVAALRAFLERERFADFFPGALPIVSLSVAIDEFPALDQKLSCAFDTSLVLSIENRDWADALIELLLLPAAVAAADDAAGFEGPRARVSSPILRDRVGRWRSISAPRDMQEKSLLPWPSVGWQAQATGPSRDVAVYRQRCLPSAPSLC
jgi:hypothetical protein